MESFKWGAPFVTGLEDVDKQHRKLVDLINLFGEHLSNNDVCEAELQTILQELADYAVYHFTEEQELMQQVDLDPRHLQPHIEAHGQFLKEVTLLRSDVSSSKPQSAKHLLDFLTHWLAFHILGSDQNMARQLRLIEAGVCPEEAYEQGEHQLDQSLEPLLFALNGLFQQVSARNHELMELNQLLEDKVAERTKELSKANKNLQEIALTDVLTKLPNRRHAMKVLFSNWSSSQQSGTPLSCMMVDADHFKEINDTYGHDAGDKVLIELSNCLKESVRTDDTVCRLGGDEFLIICPNTDLKGALNAANQVHDQVCKLQVSTGTGHWSGSVSIGVAGKISDMVNVEELIKEADSGVYKAKEQGKNCVCSTQV